MEKIVAKYIRDLKSRAGIPEVVLAEMSEAKSKGEAKRIWKEHMQTTGAKKGGWADGR